MSINPTEIFMELEAVFPRNDTVPRPTREHALIAFVKSLDLADKVYLLAHKWSVEEMVQLFRECPYLRYLHDRCTIVVWHMSLDEIYARIKMFSTKSVTVVLASTDNMELNDMTLWFGRCYVTPRRIEFMMDTKGTPFEGNLDLLRNFTYKVKSVGVKRYMIENGGVVVI